MVERRTKEIGIRKVLGVTLSGVIWEIVKEFIILVIIANIIGLLIIYFSWNSILQSGLMFMTAIKPSTYFMVIIISLITAVIAVTSQTLKSALANPVDTLKYE
ncbi:ABC transporter permease [Calditrichota bacterium]